MDECSQTELHQKGEVLVQTTTESEGHSFLMGELKRWFFD